jgi:drug/metabolite transporter (DMT)-like permease
MLLGLTAMWGSAFMFTKIAVGALPVEWVVAGRLLVGSLLLLPLAAFARRLRVRGLRLWSFLVLIALLGNALPFSLITWGQRQIDSGLAGILMAVMPLATLGLAHFLVPGERINRYRVLGFLLGFSGIIVLTGPQALTAVGGREGALVPMLAVLGGAVCYALAAVLSRLRPPSDSLSTAAAVTLLALLMTLPLVETSASDEFRNIGPTVVGAVVFLGAFSTALASVVYFRLIQSAGPAFVSQLNYLIPLWAVAVGILFLGESPQANQCYALALILAGILVAHRERRVAAVSLRERGSMGTPAPPPRSAD